MYDKSNFSWFSGTCIVQTLYNTSCIINKIRETDTAHSRINKKVIAGCLMDKNEGFE